MLKQLILITITFFHLNSFSQSKNPNEIIAEGSSKIKIRPDLVTFTLTVEKRDTIEKDAIRSLNLEIDKLIRSLYKLGFTDKTIKISDYSVSSDQDDEEKKKYTTTNILKLEFGLDTKLIDELYKEIQDAELKDLDIEFETKVSDSLEKATRLKLVQLAIEDAKINATNISKTLGIKLVRIKQVSKYVQGMLGVTTVANQVMFTPPKIVRDGDVSKPTSFEKFQVEDVELEEKITIVYEILN
jgi:uncharacterized protein YggE